MYIYLACFAASCLLLLMAEKIENRRTAAAVEVVGIFLPILLAAFRAPSIGTDVEVYVKPMYEAAERSVGFSDFLQQKWLIIWRDAYVTDYEPLFILVVYTMTKLFHSLSAVLFAIAFLIIMPIYLGLKKITKGRYLWLGMLVFYLMYYHVTLNLMRQWIAMAFLFFGFEYLIKEKYLRYFITIGLAAMFHVSALIGVVIFALYQVFVIWKVKPIGIGRIRMEKTANVILITLLGLASMQLLGVFTAILGALGMDKFIGYIDGKVGFLATQFVVRLPVIAVLVWNWKHLRRRTSLAAFYAAVLMLDLVFVQLVSINENAHRIAAFFSIYSIVIVPELIMSRKKNSGTQIMQLLMLIAYLIAYWLFYFVIRGTNETIPYLFG